MTTEEAWKEDVRWAKEIVTKLIDGPPENREYLARARKILAVDAALRQKDQQIDELCKLVKGLCDGVDRLTAKITQALDNRGEV